MRIHFDLEINFGNKKSHHNPITEKQRKNERLKLKPNCIICGKKITEKYRRKLCSAKCQVIYDKQRKHK